MKKLIWNAFITITILPLLGREGKIFNSSKLCSCRKSVFLPVGARRWDRAVKHAFFTVSQVFFLFIGHRHPPSLPVLGGSGCFSAPSHGKIIPGSVVPCRIFIHTQVLLWKLSSSRLENKNGFGDERKGLVQHQISLKCFKKIFGGQKLPIAMNPLSICGRPCRNQAGSTAFYAERMWSCSIPQSESHTYAVWPTPISIDLLAWARTSHKRDPVPDV